MPDNGKNGITIGWKTIAVLCTVIGLVAGASAWAMTVKVNVDNIIADRLKNDTRYAPRSSLETIDARLETIVFRLERIEKKLDKQK